MKKITVALLISAGLFSGSAFAKEEGENFEIFKQKMIEHVDKEIQILSQFKTCIQAATTPDAIETCRATQKASQNQLLLEMKKERLERRKKLLDAKSKKIDEILKQEKK